MKAIVFLVIAIILFAVAIGLALSQEPAMFIPSAIAPDVLAWLACLGLAVAGGISLIAAAMVSTSSYAQEPV